MPNNYYIWRDPQTPQNSSTWLIYFYYYYYYYYYYYFFCSQRVLVMLKHSQWTYHSFSFFFKKSRSLFSKPFFLYLIFCVCFTLILLFFYRSEARPLNPNMEVEGKKNQSLSSSTFTALVKEQYVPNIGEMSPGPRVQGSWWWLICSAI